MRCVVPETIPPTERTRVVRESHRGAYDRGTIYKILDEGFVCHVGFSIDGQPYVVPTLFARIGDALYFHGSAASRMLRNVSEGISVCITVTLTDGFVLARSVFNHSMNYRSVLALGKAVLVDAPEELGELGDAAGLEDGLDGCAVLPGELCISSPRKFSRAAGRIRASRTRKS